MKVALTVWDDRLSPVFDAATTMLVAEIKDGVISNKTHIPLQPTGAMRFAEMLKQKGVSVFICGAISAGYANRLVFNGIDLISFIAGKTERILEAYAKGEPIVPAFSMPGCTQHRQRRKGVTQMPGKDKTGPAGQGPGTGRKQGRCNSGPGAGKGSTPGRGQGRRGGSGQGSRNGSGTRQGGRQSGGQ